MGLVDVLVVGKRFTWFSADGFGMSRLDQFLVSWDLIKLWGVSSQWMGKMDISDHCLIML